MLLAVLYGYSKVREVLASMSVVFINVFMYLCIYSCILSQCMFEASIYAFTLSTLFCS